MDSSEIKKQTKELSRKLRTKAFFVAIVIATVLILWAANSLAWFSWGSRANVDPMNVTVQEADSVYIRGFPDSGNWYQSLFVNFFPLKPICGDGNNFFNPLYTKELVSGQNLSGVSVYTKKITGAAAFENGETVASSALVKEFEIMTDIKDTGSSSVYIASSSYLSADLENSVGSSLNSSGLSTAHIAGAMRVAIYQYDNALSDYRLTCIWIPNIYAKYQLDDQSMPSVKNNYTVSSDGIVEYHDSWTSGQPDTNDYHDNEASITLTTSSGTFSTNNLDSITIDRNAGYYVDTNGVLYVWDLDKARNAGKYVANGLAYGEENRIKMKIVVWLEGTDRECVNALMGGKMNLLIRFERGE